MSDSVWRPGAPADDARWHERRELHDAARGLAYAHDDVRARLTAAAEAFDLVVDGGDPERFWEAVAETAFTMTEVAPPLAELAYPIAGHDGLPVLAREVAARVAEQRVLRDGNPDAVKFLAALRSDALRGPRAALLRSTIELRDELRARGVVVRRSRGAPPGRRRDPEHAGKLPDELVDLIPLVRRAVRAMVWPTRSENERSDSEITWKAIARAIGVDYARFRDAWRHHHVKADVLLRNLIRIERERRALIDRVVFAVRARQRRNLPVSAEVLARELEADGVEVDEILREPRVRSRITPEKTRRRRR